MEKIDKTIKNLKKELKKLEEKKFKIMFFIYDTKGVPSGSLTYIYQTAYTLKELGYNVQMLHTEKDFVGVGEWLGEKYAKLPHFNVAKDMIETSPSDFVIIPEVFAEAMAKTKDLQCKRIALLQNYDLMTEMIPAGATWGTLKIRDCITTSKKLADRITEVFPGVVTKVVRPCVSSEFFDDGNEKKLIVNIISRDQNDINSIVKPFKWKYPMYGFVAFRYINGQNKEEFAKLLREGFLTVWNDPFTDFGISALEAMACGNIVIGKIPDSEPEWMFTDKTVKDNGLWYYNSKDVHPLIASVVQTFMKDGIPSDVLDEMKKTVSEYTAEKQVEDIRKAYIEGIFETRKTEFRYMLETLEKNNK